MPARFRRTVGIALLKLGLILTFGGLCHPPALAQPQSATKQQVGHDFWGFKDNAPQGTAAIAQTNDGFLWLGSQTGLYRFDGTRFELYHSPFGDQLPSTNISALFAPPAGGLWIGYVFGGFSFLKDGRVRNYGREITSSPTGTVGNFAEYSNGVLWAATTSGLWKFDHSRWQLIGPESNLPAGPIREARFDRDGTLWTLLGNRVASGAAKLAYLRPGSDQFQRVMTDVYGGFALDADERVVTSAESRELLDKSTGDAAERPRAYPVCPGMNVAILDRNDSVWIAPPLEPIVRRVAAPQGAADALERASHSDSETYNVDPQPFSGLVDREGNVWFGDQSGVHRFFYSPLIRQELPNAAEYVSVVADDQGAVWIATLGGDNFKLFRVANDQVELAAPGAAPGGSLGLAYRSPDEALWLGGSNGLWRLVEGRWARVGLPNEMVDQSYYLQTITQDHSGGMWVSFGRHGLYRLANGVWTSYGGREDLPKTGVVIEFTDSLGRVWFGYTRSQLAVLDGDRVQVFGPGDGLRVGNVTAIYGRGSQIWIGGEFGLQQFDHGRFNDIQATDDELLRGISGIIETTNGDLWLNGLGGIFHVRLSEISEALRNPAYRVKGEHFGTREGLPGFAFQLRPLNTAVEGTDGRLWFATSGGVVWLNPASPKKNLPPPPVTIQSILADDKDYQLGSELKFPAHTSSVQVSYAAISLSDPTAVHFRYKLKETDRDWHEAASASPVNYRNLAPGSYHFSVMATDTNGVWSDNTANAQFSILPAFYQTRWFLALCIATGALAVWGLARLRLRQVAAQIHGRLEERMAERERIARDLHDTLLQSFHGLLLRFQSASNLLPARPAEAKENLDNAIESAFAAITEGRDAVQGLRGSAVEGDDLAAAIKTLGQELAAQGTEHSAVRLRVEVEGTPQTLRPLVRDEIYRIAGEALRNAFHHARAAQIEVDLRYDERQLRLRVRDDGKGIDPQFLHTEGRAGHYGIPGMRERARLMEGALNVWTAANSGTEIELSIPASRAYVAAPSVRRGWLARRLLGSRTPIES